MGIESTLETLAVRLTVESSQLLRGVQQMEERLTASAVRVQSIGRKMSLALTAPLAAVGAMGIKAFAGFDDAMTKSLAIMDDVTADMRQQMESVAKGVAWGSVTAPKDVAESYYFLASAGLNAAQSMQALPVVEKFATAGAFNMARATELLADAQSALGMRSADAAQNMQGMQRVADVLTRANVMANASTEQFAEALTNKAAAALRLLNKDVEEGVAVLAAYADQGTKGVIAGEQLAIMLRDLQTASLRETEAWGRYGLKVYDASGKMLPLVSIIQQMERVLGSMSDKQKKMTLEMLGFQDRSVQAVVALLGVSGKIGQYEAQLRKATGYTANVAQRQLQSFGAQMAILKNRVTVVAIELGEVLAPYLAKLNRYVSEGLTWWRGLDAQTKTYVTVLGVAAAAIGPVLIGVGMLMKLAAVGAAPLLLIGAIVSRVILGPFRLLGFLAGAGLRGAFGLAGAAAGGLAALLSRTAQVGLSTATSIGRGLVSAFSVAGGAVARFASHAAGAWPRIQGAAQAAIAAVRAGLPLLWEGLRGSTYAVAGSTSAWQRFGMEARYWLVRPVEYFAAAAPGLYARGVAAIQSTTASAAAGLRTAWTSAAGFGSYLAQSARGYAGQLGGIFRAVGGSMASDVRYGFGKLGGAASSAFENQIMGRLRAAGAAFGQGWAGQANAFSSATNRALHSVGRVIGQVFHSRPVQMLGADMLKVAGYARSAASGMVAAFKAAAPVAASAVRTAMSGAFAAVRGMATLAARGTMGLAGGIGRGAMGLLNGAGMLGGMLAGTGGALGSIMSTVSTVALLGTTVASIVGVFASWPVVIAGAVAAWATLTESGQSFVSWAWSGLQPIWQPISDAIGGVTLALTNGEWGTAGQIAMLGLKASVLHGLDGILGAFGGFGRNLLKGFLNVVKFVGEIWQGAVNAIADTIINSPKLSAMFGLKDTKQLAWERKADQMKILGASAKHTKTVMDNTTDPAEKARLEGVYKKQMDAARAAGVKSIAEYQREIAGFNTQANASNYAAWIQGWRAQIDGLTNGLDELGNAANDAEAEQRRLTQGLRDMEDSAMSDAASLILGATWDDLEAFTKPLETVAAAAGNLHDQLNEPFTAKFSVEGVEAMEAGSAKAVRALHAYASGFDYPRKSVVDNTVAGVGAAGQSATAMLDAANAPARQVAAGTTPGYEFLQGTSITAAEWDATKQELDAFIASHDGTPGVTGVNTAGTITGSNTAGPGNKAEETQGKLVELFGKALEVFNKIAENTAPQRNTSGTVLVPANLDG